MAAAGKEATPEPAAEPEKEVQWHGTVKLVSQDNMEHDVDSRAAEAALLVRRYLVDRDADDDESVCRFPVEKARPLALLGRGPAVTCCCQASKAGHAGAGELLRGLTAKSARRWTRPR